MYHKSIRNSGLSSKYKEFLERDPPFFPKKFRPTPTNPVNAEIDAIRVEQQRVFVQKECQVMDLHARTAQTNLEDIATKMKSLMEGMDAETSVKDGVF